MWKFILLCLIPFAISFSQNLGRFVLVQKDGLRIEGKNGRINEHIFEGTDRNGNMLSVKTDDIETLYKSTGDKSILMGGLGFITGGAIVFFSSYNRIDDKYHTNGTIVLISSAAGALIGALVGSTSHSWEVVPLESTSPKLSNIINNQTILQLSINL
ncbi:MAG: hypothetical protein Q8940_22345 [Bacteroidota bacterium]|nr:hypothetical protein [Bacteroidota bacterium]